jgi:protein involved in polysaccharide export with SLBB domain
MEVEHRLQRLVLRGFGILLVLLPVACLSSPKRKQVIESPLTQPQIRAESSYTLACPDLIELRFDGKPELEGKVRIGPDGCVDLGEYGRAHVDGATVVEAAQKIAAATRQPRSNVQVRVVQYNSRHLFLFGQVPGEPRAVEYQGPETVTELLERSQVLKGESFVREVYIVRSQLPDAKPAEVLTVDLDAIRNRNDQRTNYRVQPQDEIYLGARPGSKLASAVPPILKPVYQTIRTFITGWH